MPVLGYGVFQITDLEECERCVSDAIEVGYRLFDTAQAYGNEEAVGRAIAKSDVPREEFGKKYENTAAQVILRWLVQRGVVDLV